MLPFIEMNFWVTVTLDHILEALWNYFGNYGHLNRAAKYLSLSYNYSPEKYVSGSPQNRLIPKDDFERHWIKYLRKDTSSKVILFLYKNWERTEKQTQFSGFGVRFRNREDKWNFKRWLFDTHSERSTDYYGIFYLCVKFSWFLLWEIEFVFLLKYY